MEEGGQSTHEQGEREKIGAGQWSRHSSKIQVGFNRTINWFQFKQFCSRDMQRTSKCQYTVIVTM